MTFPGRLYLRFYKALLLRGCFPVGVARGDSLQTAVATFADDLMPPTAKENRRK